MFDRFSESARRVMKHAREHALSYNHDEIRTEHILLGIAALGECGALTALAQIGIGAEDIRRALGNLPEGTGKVTNLPFSRLAKKALEATAEAAQGLGQATIGTPHLLLGLLSSPEGLASQTLRELGGMRAQIRPAVLRYLEQYGAE